MAPIPAEPPKPHKPRVKTYQVLGDVGEFQERLAATLPPPKAPPPPNVFTIQDPSEFPPDVWFAATISPDNGVAVIAAYRELSKARSLYQQQLTNIHTARRQHGMPPLPPSSSTTSFAFPQPQPQPQPSSTYLTPSAGTAGGEPSWAAGTNAACGYAAGLGVGPTLSGMGRSVASSALLPPVTITEAVRQGAESRRLGRFEAQQAKWDEVTVGLATRVGRPPQELAMQRGPAWRTRAELIELLYRAQPRDARGLNPDEALLTSLRDAWERVIPLGDVFSGLALHLKDKPHELPACRAARVGRPLDPLGPGGSALLSNTRLAQQQAAAAAAAASLAALQSLQSMQSLQSTGQQLAMQAGMGQQAGSVGTQSLQSQSLSQQQQQQSQQPGTALGGGGGAGAFGSVTGAGAAGAASLAAGPLTVGGVNRLAAPRSLSARGRSWEDGEVLQKRAVEYGNRLKSLAPHDPDFGSLVVAGEALEGQLAALAAAPIRLAEVEAAVREADPAAFEAYKAVKDEMEAQLRAALEAEEAQRAAAEAAARALAPQPGPHLTLSAYALPDPAAAALAAALDSDPSSSSPSDPAPNTSSGSGDSPDQQQQQPQGRRDPQQQQQQQQAAAESDGTERYGGSLSLRCHTGEVAHGVVTLRSTGTAAVRWQWRRVPGRQPAYAACDLAQPPRFVASQQCGVLLPGQSLQLRVTFTAGCSAGTFREVWILETRPPLQGPTPSLKLLLRGAAEVRDESGPARADLTARLEQREKMAAVAAAMERVLRDVRQPRRAHPADPPAEAAAAEAWDRTNGCAADGGPYAWPPVYFSTEVQAELAEVYREAYAALSAALAPATDDDPKKKRKETAQTRKKGGDDAAPPTPKFPSVWTDRSSLATLDALLAELTATAPASAVPLAARAAAAKTRARVPVSSRRLARRAMRVLVGKMVDAVEDKFNLIRTDLEAKAAAEAAANAAAGGGSGGGAGGDGDGLEGESSSASIAPGMVRKSGGGASPVSTAATKTRAGGAKGKAVDNAGPPPPPPPGSGLPNVEHLQPVFHDKATSGARAVVKATLNTLLEELHRHRVAAGDALEASVRQVDARIAAEQEQQLQAQGQRRQQEQQQEQQRRAASSIGVVLGGAVSSDDSSGEAAAAGPLSTAAAAAGGAGGGVEWYSPPAGGVPAPGPGPPAAARSPELEQLYWERLGLLRSWTSLGVPNRADIR